MRNFTKGNLSQNPPDCVNFPKFSGLLAKIGLWLMYLWPPRKKQLVLVSPNDLKLESLKCFCPFAVHSRHIGMEDAEQIIPSVLDVLNSPTSRLRHSFSNTSLHISSRLSQHRHRNSADSSNVVSLFNFGANLVPMPVIKSTFRGGISSSQVHPRFHHSLICQYLLRSMSFEQT